MLKKKGKVIYLCFIMMLFCFAPVMTVKADNNSAIAEVEPNNELKEAKFIEIGKTYCGTLLSEDTYDYYRIKLEKGISYKVAIGGISQNGNTSVGLVNPEGEDVGVKDFSSSVSFRIGVFNVIDEQGMYYATFTASITGNYYLEFSNYYHNQEKYSFYINKITTIKNSNETADNALNDIALGTSTPNFSCDEVEPNNELKEAKFIEIGKKYNGSILGEDESDYFRVKLDKSITYKIAIDGISKNGNTFVYFRDTDGWQVGVSSKYTIDPFCRGIFNRLDDQGNYYVTFTASKSGNYYLHFCNYYGNQGKYSFYIDKLGKSSEQKNDDLDASNEWINGKWYDKDGNQTYSGILSWKSNSTGWWVEDSSGWYPQNQWQKIDGVWYYFKPDGYMASAEYYGGYWFNSDGSWDDQYELSWKSNSTGWWVEDKSGWWPSSKWLKIDGSWYYFDASGYMISNQYVDGYWLGADGRIY